jgi:Uma2 family endonuclease
MLKTAKSECRKMATESSIPESSTFAPCTFIPRGEAEELVVPAIAHTLAGFRDWALSADFPDRGKLTFVGGELIIDMSPEYFETHNFIKTEITAVIYGWIKRRRSGRVFSDRCLYSNVEGGVSTEPDAMFASFSSFRLNRCQVVRGSRPGVGEELVGTPDWVLEIISTSSRRKDTKLLREAYFKAGIPEYWLVDALGAEIDFQILVPGNGGYVAVVPNGDWLDSPTFSCAFRLTREKDEDGYWQYTLEMQETA